MKLTILEGFKGTIITVVYIQNIRLLKPSPHYRNTVVVIKTITIRKTILYGVGLRWGTQIGTKNPLPDEDHQTRIRAQIGGLQV